MIPKREHHKPVDRAKLKAEILTAIEGHAACSSELSAHLGRRWQMIWDAIQELKARGLVQLDALRGRWELTTKAKTIRALVARAVAEQAPIGLGS